MSYILALDGYLKALQRLCGAGYIFGAKDYLAEDDIDNFINNITSEWESVGQNTYSYSGYEKIDSRHLFHNIEDFIFNGIISKRNFLPNDFTVKMILEDINEYYGLASTSLDENGDFHPLIKGPVYKLKIDSTVHSKSLYFLIKINKYFIITYFKIKKPE